MDHIMTYEEYLRDVKKGIVTDLGNSPVSAVLYRCEATEVNIPYHYDDGNVHMNHVMRLKKLDQYNPSFLPFEKLKAYGIGAVRGPRRMPHSLICELERNRYEQ